MGRGLPAGQSESRVPLALIGPEEFVRRAWPSEDPIGQRVGFDWDADGNFRWREVVGVIRHQKHYDLNRTGREQRTSRWASTGVISYSVAQRGHDIGVRMALGAKSQDVVVMVLKQDVGLVVVGLGVGTAASLLPALRATRVEAVSVLTTE